MKQSLTLSIYHVQLKGALGTTEACLHAALGQEEDPLKKEMATHSSILAWEIPWTEESGRLQSMGWKESTMT